MSAQATEVSILTTFLLSRASLPDIITPNAFRDLFPAAMRSNPQIKLLYRELQAARNRQTERVRKNILLEARLGAQQRSDAVAAAEDVQHADTAAEMEGIELFGAAGPAQQKRLPLRELLREMEAAAAAMDAEYRRLDGECEEILGELRTTVGDLSDLRYGKLGTTGTDEQVVSQLEHLTAACERTLRRNAEEAEEAEEAEAEGEGKEQ